MYRESIINVVIAAIFILKSSVKYLSKINLKQLHLFMTKGHFNMKWKMVFYP